jgi:MscS family membrane protein
MLKGLGWLRAVGVVLGIFAYAPVSSAQGGAPPPATTGSAQPETPKDPLGRETPRGTLLGFWREARDGNNEAAAQYLATSRSDQAAEDLAHQLYVVLDSRLPARLNAVSDRPEGALANPLKPDQDVVGTISTNNGPLDLVVERVNRGPAGRVWLFSRQTLDAIPAVYDEVDLVSVDRFLPRVLAGYRLGGVRLFDWLVLLLVIPICYRLFSLLNPSLRLVMRLWRGRADGSQPAVIQVPGFVRLLLLAAAIRWLLTGVDLPLMERRFWLVSSGFFIIISAVWMLLLLTAHAETVLHRRLKDTGEFTALLRLGRRLGEVIVIAAGVLLTLYYFGVDPTAALAGLGIGGIAVALAAQKTLENVIGGLSIIFDKAVRVGDFLKLGDTLGSVDYIGLRSTRIRTLNRTILSVPNGQIANVNIETLSARDKFWLHHVVPLRFETNGEQLRLVIDGIRSFLLGHAAIDVTEAVRVRFFRLGPYSLDVEVFAYLRAGDWERFLEIQEELLFGIMGIVERAEASIALPTQTLRLANGAALQPALPPDAAAGVTRFEARGEPVGSA